ncbi:hypothetical protein C8R47DRAFT_1066919 [Mycena vitilis]|nr:hypothetical protein C8R47DRAFT_1066919 [Mycena vitilis]
MHPRSDRLRARHLPGRQHNSSPAQSGLLPPLGWPIINCDPLAWAEIAFRQWLDAPRNRPPTKANSGSRATIYLSLMGTHSSIDLKRFGPKTVPAAHAISASCSCVNSRTDPRRKCNLQASSTRHGVVWLASGSRAIARPYWLLYMTAWEHQRGRSLSAAQAPAHRGDRWAADNCTHAAARLWTRPSQAQASAAAHAQQRRGTQHRLLGQSDVLSFKLDQSEACLYPAEDGWSGLSCSGKGRHQMPTADPEYRSERMQRTNDEKRREARRSWVQVHPVRSLFSDFLAMRFVIRNEVVWMVLAGTCNCAASVRIKRVYTQEQSSFHFLHWRSPRSSPPLAVGSPSQSQNQNRHKMRHRSSIDVCPRQLAPTFIISAGTETRERALRKPPPSTSDSECLRSYHGFRFPIGFGSSAAA